jgi:hypothetical protein
VTAVAERLTTVGVVPLLPWTVSVPDTVPAVAGVTATVKLPDWPAASDIGNDIPGRLNCGLESDACVMDTAVFPVFETATVCVVCFPTPTFPKFRLVGLT